ncbi:hypothetical protein [Corallibacter sp.]|uniref:hypothetical protein n=1 Tax=Corallibacter sp. TaxID=2038084 RepID=UPI003A8FA109
METTLKNGSKTQKTEDLISKAVQMPSMLERHDIGLPKVFMPEAVTENNGRVGYFETGMSLNITHGIEMVAYLTTYGADYNPSNAALTVASLEALNVAGQDHLDTARATMHEHKLAVQARQDIYKDLQPLATRVLNELEASGAPEATIIKAKHYVDKIRGKRIKKIAADSTKKHISASQTSFTERIQHLTDLISVLTPCAEYQPNIAALQITGLEAKRDAMKASIHSVSTAKAGWSASLLKRNAFFNEAVTGYVATYLAVKHTVKAIFGANSAQYKQIGGLSFKRIRD